MIKIEDLIIGVAIFSAIIMLAWQGVVIYDQKLLIRRLKRDNDNLDKFNQMAVREVMKYIRRRNSKGQFIS